MKINEMKNVHEFIFKLQVAFKNVKRKIKLVDLYKTKKTNLVDSYITLPTSWLLLLGQSLVESLFDIGIFRNPICALSVFPEKQHRRGETNHVRVFLRVSARKAHIALKMNLVKSVSFQTFHRGCTQINLILLN